MLQLNVYHQPYETKMESQTLNRFEFWQACEIRMICGKFAKLDIRACISVEPVEPGKKNLRFEDIQ